MEGSPPPEGDPSWEYYEHSLESKDEVEEEYVRGSLKAKAGKFGDKMVVLPQKLKELIDERIKGEPLKELKEQALRIFVSQQSQKVQIQIEPENNKKKQTRLEKNRRRPNLESLPPHNLKYDDKEVLAYLAAVLPSNYASTYRVLSEVKARLPESFHPKRIYDFGVGPGTGLWASDQVFGTKPDDLYQGVDLSESMLEVAESFIRANGSDQGFQNSVRLERHFSFLPQTNGYDMVLSAFTLSELPSPALVTKALQALWDRCSGVLVVVEKGTPKGFSIISEARKLLLSQGGTTVAPCPHDRPCPLLDTTRWCHFQQKVQRPKFTMDVKSSKSNLESGSFSYLVIKRGTRPELTTELNVNTSSENAEVDRDEMYHWNRIIDRPAKRGAHVQINMCTKEGLQSQTFTKSMGNVEYRDARKANWSDLFPYDAKHKLELKFGTKIKTETRTFGDD